MIYVHIPFCIQKCHYCDFLSYAATKKTRESYWEELIASIKNCDYSSIGEIECEISSLYFGGGTPTILFSRQLKKILEAILDKFPVKFDAEISLEANPETVSFEKLSELKKMGFNRISFGAQTLNDDELTILNRAHSTQKFFEAFHNARRAEFSNINVDIISSIPGQTLQSFRNTLDTLVNLNPEHISCYSLIIEKGTYLYKNLAKFPPLPTEDETYKMDEYAYQKLKEAGYRQYEISNFAKSGYECAHNIGYWERKPYLGFGYGAASLIKHGGKDIRFERKRDSHDICNVVELSDNERMEEFMFLGLRKTKGISKLDFLENFGHYFDEVYGKIYDLQVRQGLIIAEGDRIYLTKRGREVANMVMGDYIFNNER